MTVPRWSRFLLSLAVPAERRDDVLGDLEEVHLRRVDGKGGLKRVCWRRLSSGTASPSGGLHRPGRASAARMCAWLSG